MSFDWSDYEFIAQALHRHHADVNRLTLSMKDLSQLIVALPHFSGAPKPPSDSVLNHILWTWMRIADESALSMRGTG